MAKKRKRKHVYKGVRYIAVTLKKYFKGKYGSYAEALPRAREIMADLKKRGEKVGTKTIFPMERKTRGAKKGSKKNEVVFVPELLEVRHFFSLSDYPSMIAFCSNNVFFESKLYPSTLPEIQGGDVIEYSEYFAPFVSYINGMMALEEGDSSTYETDWWVRCTEPKEVSPNRFVSKIISCNASGDKTDYGFNPEEPTMPTEVVVSEVEQKPITTETPTVTGPSASGVTKDDLDFLKLQTEKINAETQKTLAEAEKLRQENINALLKRTDLTKLELKEWFERLKL